MKADVKTSVEMFRQQNQNVLKILKSSSRTFDLIFEKCKQAFCYPFGLEQWSVFNFSTSTIIQKITTVLSSENMVWEAHSWQSLKNVAAWSWNGKNLYSTLLRSSCRPAFSNQALSKLRSILSTRVWNPGGGRRRTHGGCALVLLSFPLLRRQWRPSRVWERCAGGWWARDLLKLDGQDRKFP